MKTPHCGCAAGTQCKAPPSANLADSPHLCWGCNKKIHSSLLCEDSILNLLSSNPSYIGRSLSNGHLIQEDDNNEILALCFTCIALLLEARKWEEAQKLNACISDMLAVPPPAGITWRQRRRQRRQWLRELWRQDRQGSSTKTASNDNANPRSNVQAHPRKVNYRQLPLNKHMPSTVYYHSAFTTYPRHNHSENVASTPDVLDTLLKAFSSRARVDSQKIGILPLHHGPLPRTSYRFFPCHPWPKNLTWVMTVLCHSPRLTWISKRMTTLPNYALIHTYSFHPCHLMINLRSNIWSYSREWSS